MMRKLSIMALISTMAATSSIAGSSEEFEAAAAQVALAAGCRATYGEQELFEVAFERFEEAARSSGEEISDTQIEEIRQNLYETDAMEGENPFMFGFCAELKKALLPDQGERD